MDENLDLGSEVRGRIFHTTAFGDTAGEIEIAALTAAQAFFGDGVPLEVVQDYMASGTTRLDRERAGDKKFVAEVNVRAAGGAS